MTATPLFLDTSIQVSRKNWNKAEIDKIDEVIKRHGFITTSSYVRLEFKRSYIQDLIYLHRDLVLENSFIRTFSKVKNLTAHWGHRRRLSNTLEALVSSFADIKSFHSDDSVDKDLAERLALYLEIALENIWDWFKESVDWISDDTGCIPSKEPPRKKKLVFEGKTNRCRSEKIRCKLNKFFKEKEHEFKKIQSYIRKLDVSEKKKQEELNNIVSTIEEGLKNPDSLCNTNQCRRLGDALIAVEAMHFKELFTKDVDQAEVICKSIDLKSHLL